MHGAGEQQQQHAQPQQQQRYRYATRNEEQSQQPSNSAKSTARVSSKQSIHASLICTPTTTSTTSSSGDDGALSCQRSQQSVMRAGQPIKIGNSILEPAGTLVFAKNDSPTWSSGQRIIVHGNKHAVVQANLFPIGPPVLTVQAPTNGGSGNWYLNQQSKTSTDGGNGNVLLSTSSSNASATPDSGIQSVPTSPPSPGYELMNRDPENFDNDDTDDHEDFTDMPILRPVDEEDECFDVASTSCDPIQTDVNSTLTPPPVHSTTTPSPAHDELTNGMNAEEFLSVSIASNMGPDEIVRRLFEYDPEKANSIAMLIKKHSAEELKSKKKKDMEAEVSSTTPATPRTRCTRNRTKPTTRSTNSPDVTTSTLIEEPSTFVGTSEEFEDSSKLSGKKRGRKPKKKRTVSKDKVLDEDVVVKKLKVEAETEPKNEASTDDSDPLVVTMQPVDPVQFRLRVREMMERQLEQLTETMSSDMTELRLSHATTSKIGSGKRKESFFRQLNEQSKRLRKSVAPVPKKKLFFGKEYVSSSEVNAKIANIKKEEKDESTPSKIRCRLSSRLSRTENTPETVMPLIEEKFNGEYYEITKSIPYSDDIIPLWKSPSLSCGCTKGACTSDMECLNRALRVQCSHECTVPYCSNRRFWKEECGSKLCLSNGARTKRVLKTKVARKSGDFLCEYAGEVISNKMGQERFNKNQDTRIIAIGSQLFIDPSNRGNVGRFIKHSCSPNCRLEVWSVSGFYRAGVFALYDLSTNVEVTVDKNGLLPFDSACNCGAADCKKIIKGVRRGVIVNQDENEVITTRRFLSRNRRKTIQNSRKCGIPPILLIESHPSLHLKMKKVLAAFSFRVRRIDGSMPRSMLPYYNSILTYLEVKSKKASVAEFVSLFRKWLDALDDDDLERAFSAIESHYLSSSIQSVQPSKKSNETAPRARATSSSSCISPVPSKRGDADLSYLESSYPIGSYDPDGAWEAYRANSADNAVRCVCGALDEDGDMVQCDECQFWLHIDCCEVIEDESEYICDFCRGRTGQSPTVDVKLREQPEVRFENCHYYRSLMNRRGVQVRLNETVYVNRAYNDDHKNILKNLHEEKKGVKQREPTKYKFPKASSEPLPVQNVDRKDARIFRVERLFVCPGNNRFVFGSFYAYPHETFAETGRVFCKKEVFATPYYETLPLDEVIGRCLVVDELTWCKGRPKVPMYKEDDVFLCEMQVGRNKRVFEKVPKGHRYPINEKSYVFTEFSKPLKVIKDFRPYDPANSPPKTLKPQASTSGSSMLPQSSSNPLPDVNMRQLSSKRIQRILKHLAKNK